MDPSWSLEKIWGRFRIRTKLCIIVSALIALIFLFIYSYFPSKLRAQALGDIASKGNSFANMMSFSVAPALLFEDLETIEETIAVAKQNPDVLYVVVLDHAEQVLASLNLDKAHQAKFLEASLSGNISKNGTIYRTRSPILNDTDPIGELLIGFSMEDLNLEVSRSQRNIAFLSFLIFSTGVVAVFLITSLATRPLARIVETVKWVAKGDLKLRSDVSSQDDVGEWAKAFSQMVDNLESAYKKLEEVNENLEKRISERTRELKDEIAQRGKVEEHLRHAKERAEEAGRAKSQFLANMSHEIRTPMNGVSGMPELLARTNLSEKQRKFVESLNQSGTALLSTINEILDFSKIEAGELELDIVDFELRQTVEEVIQLLAELAQNKGLELTCRITNDGPEALRGDPLRLRQILTNLISNAIKFTESGQVSVSVKNLGLAESRNAYRFRFDVSDTGIGISPEHKKVIFDSFSQADGSTTRLYGGTSLGLSISKQLVRMMGGTIQVESELGEGSTFGFTAYLEAGTASPRSVSKPQDLAGLRALIVDDNETNLDILHHQLGAWGIKTQAAENGQQALARWHESVEAKQAFDLLILDRDMPGMDGIEVAKVIQPDLASSGVPVIMLSSVFDTVSGSQVREIGISATLCKPVRQSELYNSVCKVMKLREPQPRDPQDTADNHVTAADNSLQTQVLLVEDNPVNQEVALEMLRLLRCQVSVANNGLEAVELFKMQSFDAVLMDCHMPEMDGYQATDAIRNLESSRTTSTPIIALTANAMQEDRERCLSAGMDDYLAKPFHQEELQALLQRWLEDKTKLVPAPAPDSRALTDSSNVNGDTQPSLDPTAIQNLRALEERGSKNIFQRVVQLYMADSNNLLSKLNEAIESGHCDDLRMAAHGLKSSSSNVGALKLASLCQELEMLGRSRKVEKAPEILAAVRQEYRMVKTALAEQLEQCHG